MSLPAGAQSNDVPLSYFQIVQKFEEQRLKEAISRPTGVPLSHLVRIGSKPDLGGLSLAPGQCAQQRQSSAPNALKAKKKEIVLVVQGVAAPGSSPRIHSENFFLHSAHEVLSLGGVGFPVRSKGEVFDVNDYKKRVAPLVTDYLNLHHGGGESEMLNRSVWVESIVRWASVTGSAVSEDELRAQIAQKIREFASHPVTGKVDPHEVRALYSIFQDRLYRNYNDFLNPQQNAGQVENPKDISLAQMISAAAVGDKLSGGVCTNIAKAMLQIGQELFPKEQGIVINNGSHFAVLSKEENGQMHIYNWSDHFVQSSGGLEMSKSLPVTNTRISILNGNVLQEIGVVDTEANGVIRSMMKPGLAPKMSATLDPSQVYTEFKTQVGNRSKSIKAGVGQTTESSIRVVMAEFEGNHSIFSAGAAHQQTGGSKGTPSLIVFIRYGKDIPIIHYQAPGVEVRFVAGANVEGSYGIVLNHKNSDFGMADIPAYSANLTTHQKVMWNTVPKRSDQVVFRGYVGSQQFLGSRNLGEFQAEVSKKGFAGFMGPMKSLAWMPQQFFGGLNAKKPISPTAAFEASLDYQGTNLWQVTEGQLGITLQPQGGSVGRFYVFGGYTDNRAGYKTKMTLNQKPSGINMRAGLETRSGKQFEVTGQGFGKKDPTSREQIKVRALINIGNRKR